MKVTNDPVLNIYDFLIQKQTGHETIVINTDQDMVDFPLRNSNSEHEPTVTNTDQEKKPTNAPKKKHTGIFICWIIVFLTIILVIAFFLWGEVFLEPQLYKDIVLLILAPLL